MRDQEIRLSEAVAAALQDLLAEHGEEFADALAQHLNLNDDAGMAPALDAVNSFSEAGVLTSNAGLVLTLMPLRNVQITVV